MKAAPFRLLSRALVVGAAASILPLADSAPSALALVVPIPMGVGVRSLPDPDHATAHEVCVYGQAASATSRWDLVITGARVYLPDPVTVQAQTAEVDGWVIDQRYTYATPILNTCVTVSHAGAFAGHFQATLVYTGIGTDVSGALVGTGTWAGSHSDSMGTNLGAPPMP